ncbi:LysR family transcriptional regulator [Pandoraea anhela]|uniref:LysR family transcriptional regulator n=1 Tax=Pandoraea anhela TaxID=2508295 RepID=A0A5E4WCS1_9BURK|nr:LysR family transcriptional regulator [Pandoraea anhela]VVE21170.1 LysR family transcriptional regulator [Pandoraea anhela]
MSSLTIKQVEAFYWVARLGTVSRAADKLHITQSAATKRLQELESACVHPLLENIGSRMTLTQKGREMLVVCEALLARLAELDALKKDSPVSTRTLLVGLTEVVAMTWFPEFMKRMRKTYPDVVVQPALVHRSSVLREKVLDGTLDLAFVPDVGVSAKLMRVPLNIEPYAWYAPVGTFPEGELLSLQALAACPMIEQEDRSVINDVCRELLSSCGVTPQRLSGGSGVFGTAALVEAGVGVSCLPQRLMTSHVAQRRVQRIETTPAAPSLRYCAIAQRQPSSVLGAAAAEIARQSCVMESREQGQ